jgi:hypothetical protein
MAIPLFFKIEFAMEPLFIQVDSNLCGTAIFVLTAQIIDLGLDEV